LQSTKSSRRSVLSFGVKAAAAYGLSNLARPLAAASSVNRACVCLYLNGGNDSNNMIVPLDSPAYELYDKGRGTLALPKRELPNGFLALPWAIPAESRTRGSGVSILQHDVTEAGSPAGLPRLGPATPLSTRLPQTPIGLQLETIVNRLKGGIAGQQGFVCIRS